MNREVRVGFGDSRGNLKMVLIKEDYVVIERMNVKASVSRPKIYLKRLPQIDIGIYKNLISRKRNQMMLQSFIGIRENNNGEELLFIKTEAQKQAREKEDQINTIKYMASVQRINKFVTQTRATEAEAREYLDEHNGNLQESIKVYNQRSVMINAIASRQNISLKQAKEFLKANNYDLSLLD